MKNIQVTHGFHCLHKVYIRSSLRLRHVTWLIFTPNLKDLGIDCRKDMEEIIKLDEAAAEAVENLIPFERLQFLLLRDLENLKSIYSKPLPLPSLKEMTVKGCPKLKRLPLDCNNPLECKLIIKVKEHWWKDLQRNDQATQRDFLTCFISIDND